jgi:cation:H+ antiporter
VEVLERALHAGAHSPAEASGTRGAAKPILIPLDVAAIVAGSFGMVEAALALADHAGAPRELVGVLVLAPLTSLPNAYTAVRLGLARRGAALVSETLNSNTLNLLAGLLVPAVFVSGFAHPGTGSKLEVAFLLGMTLVALALLRQRRGMGRAGGALLVGLYMLFVGLEIALR